MLSNFHIGCLKIQRSKKKKKEKRKKSLINAQSIYTVYRHCEINRGL